MNLTPMGMGKRIEIERKARGWTQAELSDRVPNLTQQSLDRLEKRDSDKSEHVAGIADALEVSLRWLITGNGRKEDTDWPFSRVDRLRWNACNDTDRGYVQAALNKALDECEEARAPVTKTSQALLSYVEAEIASAQPGPKSKKSAAQVRAGSSRSHVLKPDS